MKITEQDKKRLFSLLDARLAEIGVEKIKSHRANRLGKDIEMRFRWDLLNASKIDLTSLGLYDYLHDSHIDTALKQYVELHKEYLI